jgi:hypothetical protein
LLRGPVQQNAHPHPDLQAAAEVGAVLLQIGRIGLQDGHLLLAALLDFFLGFPLGLLQVVQQPL